VQILYKQVVIATTIVLMKAENRKGIIVFSRHGEHLELLCAHDPTPTQSHDAFVIAVTRPNTVCDHVAIIPMPQPHCEKKPEKQTPRQQASYLDCEEYLVTAFVPSETACLASSPGRMSLTEV